MHWTPTLYDVDSIFGSMTDGTFIIEGSVSKIVQSLETASLSSLYKAEIESRYSQLRKEGIFSVDNIISLLNKWVNQVGYDNFQKEITLFGETPSYRDGKTNDGWVCVNIEAWDKEDEYNDSKTYNASDKCSYYGYIYQATKL